jgi:hypothetical protein
VLIFALGLLWIDDPLFAQDNTESCRDLTCNKNIRLVYDHLYEVRIPQKEFDIIAHSPDQEKSHWCWAASLQMLFKLIGINKNQSDIVREVHRSLENKPATPREMVKYINGWHTNEHGKKVLLFSTIEYFIPQIIFDLANGFPVILDMKVDSSNNHAYLITSAQFLDFFNKTPLLMSVTARDPWNGNPKFTIFSLDEISKKAHLIIGVREYAPE